MNFTGKVAVVTGGANGIGLATARRFAQSGAAVMIVDHDATRGKAALAELREHDAQARFFSADVTRSADVAAYVAATTDAFGRIDCFFNNAGIEGSVAQTVDYDEAMFDAIIAVNLKGVFLGMKHVLPVMLKQGSGAVVNTASVAGITGSPGMPAYCASKHAVIGMTKVAAGEVARRGVRVNAVCPGPVDTRMIHALEAQLDPDDPQAVMQRYQASIPSGRYTTAEEIAAMVLFLCSNDSGNTNGGQFVVDGGRTATGGAVTMVQPLR